ncbi:hypothetical protein QUF72_01070 [Desulfobacterales bacterium HSG2]|nr:hypothetical protein [Desulfobacterales bacterium HSG2]
MRVKNIVFAALFMLAGIIMLASTGCTRQAESGKELRPEQDRCALMMRKGKESFARSHYEEANKYFRQAVQADPASQDAWSYYDLSLVYTVAEQFRNHGRIVTSTAPSPEDTDFPSSETPDSSTETPPRKTIDEKPAEHVPAVKPKPPLIMDDEGC